MMPKLQIAGCGNKNHIAIDTCSGAPTGTTDGNDHGIGKIVVAPAVFPYRTEQQSNQFTFFRNSNPLKVSYTRTPLMPPMERLDSTVPVLNSRPNMGSRLTTVIWISL